MSFTSNLRLHKDLLRQAYELVIRIDDLTELSKGDNAHARDAMEEKDIAINAYAETMNRLKPCWEEVIKEKEGFYA